jgi:RecB family endonuclease NucS
MTRSTWIVIAADGRHVTVGRSALPDADDLDRAAEALRALGIPCAWLARCAGDYYGRKRPVLHALRAIVGTPDAAAWEAADAAWHQARCATLASCTPPSRTRTSAAA